MYAKVSSSGNPKRQALTRARLTCNPDCAALKAERPVKIRTDIVGTPLRERRCEVRWRRTMNYAAAVGDANPRFLDDTRDDGLAVHPIFPVALTWPIIENIGEQLEGLVPPEAIPRMVHASEHIAWHGPMRPGDDLVMTGRIAAVVPKSAGALVVLRIEAKRKDGAPVFTEHIGGLFRGVPCDGPAAGEDDLPRHETGSSGPGENPVWSEEIPVSPLAAHVYDGCADIVFPIHTSPAIARFAGLPGIILQGTATLAMAASRIVDREAGGDPLAVSQIACSFRKPVLPGSTIRLDLLARRPTAGGVDLDFSVLNAEGQTALQDGWARFVDHLDPVSA